MIINSISWFKILKRKKGVVVVVVIVLEVGRGQRKGGAGVGEEPTKFWPWTHWRRRDRRANAWAPNESILFLISMTLLKDVQDPEDQTGDTAWGLGLSLESFHITQSVLVIPVTRVRMWNLRRGEGRKEERDEEECTLWGGNMLLPPAGTKM